MSEFHYRYKTSDDGVIVTPEELNNISNLFKIKGWQIDYDNASGLFNRFCDRYSLLSTDQRALMIELSMRFQRYTAIDYENKYKEFFDFLSLLIYRRKLAINNLIVMPLIAPKDKGKNKSSNLIQYLLRSTSTHYNEIFKGMKFRFIDRVEMLINDDTNEYIALVDDFIGSGDTAIEAVNELIDLGFNKDKIIIYSIVAHRNGIEKINGENVELIYSIYAERGIADKYSGTSLNEYILLMERIESKLKISKKYRFGYKKCEALISMMRTPNNTFPLFWSEKANTSNAPFPR